MKIKLNGKLTETECNSVYQLCDSLFKKFENTTVIINSFQLKSDRSIKENDEIFLIDKNKMPEKEELSAMLFARHTPKIHEKIQNSRVAVAGLGGLGSHIAVSLARTGVGILHLIDFDVVEPSNLNRQQYMINHLGMYKTDALKEEILQINPFVKIITHNVQVNKSNIYELFKEDFIICEAFDDPKAKATLVNGILTQFTNKKIVASSGMAGFDSSNSIITKKINGNFYICGDGKTEAKEGRGLMAPRVSICAGHQANMILRLILGYDNI
ncbi:sulfur carrier protein ThiS adenylyltransferase ThiF [Anaerovorax odorimutans]|uniref:sulfur carrier protein ThiS adenylyltransferase ThiF n=1 Tax=Anaerovorax odorimutans TaxID=109327 RepID=UPI0004108AEF|nr:sulfur carrier protein ThiS adenylyltransferase ThiF [Anaerovorax odorimutans]